MASTTLLLLTDSRMPAGGHAHSGGLEAAVAAGRVRDIPQLAAFLHGRLATAGLVAAAFAAYAVTDPTGLDAEFDARTPSPVLRRVSRQQGRALLRAGRAMWPVPAVTQDPHQPVALGIVAAAAGLDPHDAALAAAYAAITGPASAAVRLLGLDPYAVQGLLAALAADCDRTAAQATTFVGGPLAELPAAGAPLLDISAEIHANWEVRFFAS